MAWSDRRRLTQLCLVRRDELDDGPETTPDAEARAAVLAMLRDNAPRQAGNGCSSDQWVKAMVRMTISTPSCDLLTSDSSPTKYRTRCHHQV